MSEESIPRNAKKHNDSRVFSKYYIQRGGSWSASLSNCMMITPLQSTPIYPIWIKLQTILRVKQDFLLGYSPGALAKACTKSVPALKKPIHIYALRGKVETWRLGTRLGSHDPCWSSIFAGKGERMGTVELLDWKGFKHVCMHCLGSFATLCEAKDSQGTCHESA